MHVHVRLNAQNQENSIAGMSMLYHYRLNPRWGVAVQIAAFHLIISCGVPWILCDLVVCKLVCSLMEQGSTRLMLVVTRMATMWLKTRYVFVRVEIMHCGRLLCRIDDPLSLSLSLSLFLSHPPTPTPRPNLRMLMMTMKLLLSQQFDGEVLMSTHQLRASHTNFHCTHTCHTSI